MKSLLHPV